MKRLVIDGNAVFEIDENCVKQKKIPDSCGVKQYLANQKKKQTKDLYKAGR